MTHYKLHIITGISALLFGSSFAGEQQPIRYVITPTKVPMIDITSQRNFYWDIFPESSQPPLSPCIVQTFNRQNFLMCYKLQNDHRIHCRTSQDGTRTWSAPFIIDSLNADPNGAISIFSLRSSIILPVKRAGVRDQFYRRNLVLFSDNNPLTSCVSTNYGDSWSNSSIMNHFSGSRISSVVRLRSGAYLAVFNMPDIPTSKEVIYSSYSYDGGFSWTKPEVILRHNRYSIANGILLRATGKKGSKLVMIATNKTDGSSVFSASYDDGQTWSYPVELPAFLHGNHYAAVSSRSRLYIVYRQKSDDLSQDHPNNSNLFLWVGTFKELEHGGMGSYRVKLADICTPEVGDDPIYIAVNTLQKQTLSIIVQCRWTKDKAPEIKSIILDLKLLDNIYQNNSTNQ